MSGWPGPALCAWSIREWRSRRLDENIGYLSQVKSALLPQSYPPYCNGGLTFALSVNIHLHSPSTMPLLRYFPSWHGEIRVAQRISDQS